VWCIRVGRLHLERVTGFYRLNDPNDASEGAALVEMDAHAAARNM